MDDELTDGEQLSMEARRLIDAAMAQDVPPAEDVEGSWGMVVTRLSGGIARAELPDEPPARRTPGWIGVAIAVGVAAAVGGLLWLAIRPKPPTPGATPVPAAAQRVAPAKSAAPAPAAATLPAPQADSHVQLLVDAETALPSDPKHALELLDRHAEVAPLADAERRMALRIDVLCALDRTEDAKAQAHAFFATSRGSQWTARVRASCAN